MKRLVFLTILILLAFALGCSGGQDLPTSPGEIALRDTASDLGHMLWGMWQFTVDPVAETLEFVPLRIADMHLNALPFLEPPPLVNLTLESLQFNGNIIEADIGLRHPFLGLDEFTGFDVCGILMSKGSMSGFADTGLVLPWMDDLRLLNPDGFARWWNPSEFPVNDGTMFSYNDGLLGAPHSVGQYNATLNGYKYFCGDFDNPDDPMGVVDPEGRGVFRAGEKNIRHYSIQMGSSGLVFNYAVDASWHFPVGPKPWTVPDAFPSQANRPEPWWIDAQILNNMLWNDGANSGGLLSMTIDVYDWYDIDMNHISVESPGNIDAVVDIAPSGGGVGFSTYEVDIVGATPAIGMIPVLITAECEAVGFGGNIPGVNTAAYQALYIPVSNEPIEVVAEGTAEFDPYFDGFGPLGTTEDPVPTEWFLTLDASASSGAIVDYLWEMNGDDMFDEAEGMIVSAAFPDTGTHVIKLKVTNGAGGEAIYQLPDTYEVVDGTYVWAAFSGASNGSRDNPWENIPDALEDVGADGYILVRGDNGAGGQCVYADDLLLTSVNQGTRIQGYYGDYDTDEPPMQTGCVRVEGDDITFDGFEVTGPSNSYYTPYGHYSKLGMDDADNVLFRHLYIHNIDQNQSKAILAWAGGQLKVENVLEVDLECSYQKNQSHYDEHSSQEPVLTFLNCTFDRLGTHPFGMGLYRSGGVAEIYNCIWTDCGTGTFAYIMFAGGASNEIDYTCTCDTPTPPDGGVYYNQATPGPHCITDDPLYVAPYTDHHLDDGSPCIDTGDPSIQDYDGSTSDMGCYGGPYGDWDFEN